MRVSCVLSGLVSLVLMVSCGSVSQVDDNIVKLKQSPLAELKADKAALARLGDCLMKSWSVEAEAFERLQAVEETFALTRVEGEEGERVVEPDALERYLETYACAQEADRARLRESRRYIYLGYVVSHAGCCCVDAVLGSGIFAEVDFKGRREQAQALGLEEEEFDLMLEEVAHHMCSAWLLPWSDAVISDSFNGRVATPMATLASLAKGHPERLEKLAAMRARIIAYLDRCLAEDFPDPEERRDRRALIAPYYDAVNTGSSVSNYAMCVRMLDKESCDAMPPEELQDFE